ncbi:hypothetical protein TGGT1_254700 [Toxoplasma gondii GT1]|uniref:Uncharacterized protein n=1 Tax=Toxoplasma gondii (strain ATCC 50853 / GT1) TaxID=507601 RepID=S7UM68_TOXGG|nr:hypothetical protein TGGT1_254700 [Toxoplasma gondii GT1]
MQRVEGGSFSSRARLNGQARGKSLPPCSVVLTVQGPAIYSICTRDTLRPRCSCPTLTRSGDHDFVVRDQTIRFLNYIFVACDNNDIWRIPIFGGASFCQRRRLPTKNNNGAPARSRGHLIAQWYRIGAAACSINCRPVARSPRLHSSPPRIRPFPDAFLCCLTVVCRAAR